MKPTKIPHPASYIQPGGELYSHHALRQSKLFF
ncbi:hypothetical protein GGC63_001735 [Paenibacillus sp. OAS669]|nr:hypothetical protein [Paenibacillus sp. OAS669]